MSAFPPSPDEPRAAPPLAQPVPRQIEITEIPNYKPVVTYVILGLTVLVYLAQIGTLYLLKMDIPGMVGAKINEYIVAGQIWRLFTPMLLHDDRLPIHIISNMYFLVIVGSRVEKFYGHGRFLLLYILAGFAGNVTSFLFSTYASWGASTALFGLMGAEAIFVLQNRSMLADNGRKGLQNVLTVVGMNVIIGIMVGADNWGHIGGLLGGLAFAWFGGVKLQLEEIAYPRFRVIDSRSLENLLTGAALVAVVFGFLAAMKIFGIIAF